MESGKVLIYGGAFDPPHLGHVETAFTAIKEMRQREYMSLWFMPCATDVFGHKKLTGGSHRVEMLERTLSEYGTSEMSVSTFELDMNNQAGTYAMLKQLEMAYPSFKFAFVMGSDQAQAIKKWRNSRSLRREFPIVVVRRMGKPPFTWLMPWATRKPHVYIEKHNMDNPMSSTDVRQYVRSGFVTAKLNKTHIASRVKNYIKRNGLYR
jgi:nicotinate-nucleotide adenylyltransferase